MDCGPRTTEVGIDFQTKGQLVPDIVEIRDRMNKEGFKTTNVDDVKRCVESYDHIPGRKPLTYDIKRTVVAVKIAVHSGRYVHLCLDYGKFNQVMAKTGDPNFSEGHSVGVCGEKTSPKGEVLWLLYDSLDDSRRDEIPQGPRWAARAKLIVAVEAFAGGQGKAVAGAFGGGQKR